MSASSLLRGPLEGFLIHLAGHAMYSRELKGWHGDRRSSQAANTVLWKRPFTLALLPILMYVEPRSRETTN